MPLLPTHLWYYAASLLVVVLAARQILHVVAQVRGQAQEQAQEQEQQGQQGQGYLTQISTLDLTILSLLSLYVLIPLRAEHTYHAEASRRGCKPVPKYPAQDILGLRYLLQTARALKGHFMLQSRREVLEGLGHTFVHGVFPEWEVCITTDEPEIVKTVLSSRFEDWVLPGIRIRSFLPVLGKRELNSLLLLLVFFSFPSFFLIKLLLAEGMR